MTDFEPHAELEQIERYEFRVQFPDSPYGPLLLDEAPPTGNAKGPYPIESLAMAVGHCMSSTLFNTLERAHVPASPLRTTVRVEVGRNDKGRLRVRRLGVEIQTAPQTESDRERFDHCVEIFADFCTVSGAVREGIPIESNVVRPYP
ncbi:MAG: OsmC family protein [Thermoplasmata archaeon]